MKIALIGASGFVGNALLKELLERNHQVTAIARNTSKIELKHPNLHMADADVLDTDWLVKAIAGSDVVLSAYNPGWTNPNIHEDYLKGAAAIQDAVEKAGIKRFLVIGGAGTLQINGNYVVDGPDFPKEIYPAASAVRNYFVESLSQNSSLDWTFFSPALEMNAFSGDQTKTGKYRTAVGTPIFDAEGRSRHSVQDLAVAVADELENPQFTRQIFTAAY